MRPVPSTVVPERLTHQEFALLVSTELDAFKLTIRAWAAIEAEIDGMCEELVRVPMKGGMRDLGPVGKRIAVASALDVVPPDLGATPTALQQLRNDFGHGDLDDIDEMRANQLPATGASGS